MESPRIIAAKAGQRKYTGKPCKACGATLRYTINSGCVACTLKAREQDSKNVRELLEKAGV